MKTSIIIKSLNISIEYVNNIGTESVYKNKITPEEREQKNLEYSQPYKNILEKEENGLFVDPKQEIELENVFEILTKLPDYQSGILFESLIEILPKRKIKFCKLLIKYQDNKINQLNVKIFSWLQRQKTNKARKLLAWCVYTNRLLTLSINTLVDNLGYPRAGELPKVITMCFKDESLESKRKLFRLLGISISTFKYNKKRSKLKMLSTITHVKSIPTYGKGVELIDLSDEKTRKFPEELLKCPNLKMLRINEDYFNERQMKAIESKIPKVQITWTRGMYIDGKHGR